MTETSGGTSSRRFLTAAQVATMLSIGLSDVEAMAESGELPAIRIGAGEQWRIEESVLDGFLEAKYEESRRSALWRGFDFGSIVDIDPGTRRIPPHASPREP